MFVCFLSSNFSVLLTALKYVNFVMSGRISSCLNSGPAAALSVPAGWFRVGSCDDARTACAVTVFWRPYLVQVSNCNAVC